MRAEIVRLDALVDRGRPCPQPRPRRCRLPALERRRPQLALAAAARAAFARGGDRGSRPGSWSRWVPSPSSPTAPSKRCSGGSGRREYADIEFHHGLRRPITSSFPSGHATAAFCAASLLGGGPGWYALATTVAATRVYVRLHYTSDVVAGACFGLALGAGLRRFVR